MENEFRMFVGIDWATELHQVCVLDPRPRIIAERAVDNTGDGLAAFRDWLVELSQGAPGTTAVAIETPHGAVVDTLVQSGFCVFAINPKQLDRFRDRHTTAGAKDDRRDAFVLADSLRTDRDAFRLVRVDDPRIIQLREFGRVDEDLAHDMRRLENRDQLQRVMPELLKLVPAGDEPWLWSLLARAATPQALSRLHRDTVEAILRQHRIRRLTTGQVMAALKATRLTLAPGVVEAAAAHIATLIPRLRLTREQRNQCASAMDKLLDELAAPEPDGEILEHRDVTILQSLPGVGRITAATVLAEASAALAARDYHSLRSQTGVAPVTRQSGKKRQVLMRRACSGRLRNAVYHWARVATTIDAPSRRLYDASRSRGHSHGRALRALADRWLRILIAMLKAGKLYDPERAAHTAMLEVTC